jgi:hypothetical protein
MAQHEREGSLEVGEVSSELVMSTRLSIDIRALHMRLADADTRAVTADDVAAFLAGQGVEVRDCEQFRAAERDAAYSSREEGGE